MALPLLPTDELNLTDLSRQGLLVRAQTLATQVNPEWQDFSVSHAENILLEALAMMASMVGDTQNERVRQLSWATVTSRLAAIRNGKLTGYTMSPASAAQTAGYFYLPSSGLATVQITIPAGTRLQNGDYEHQTLTEVDILVGSNTSASLAVENSVTEEETFVSDDSVNQVMQLDSSPYMDGSLAVVCADGTYLSVDGSSRAYRSFTEMGPSTQGYLALVDDNGRVLVLFGNSINGAIPQGAISMSYKTTDGDAGRVSSGSSSWEILDSLLDVNGNPTTVLFTNTADSTGGFDMTSVEEARVRAPLSHYVIESCSTGPQFEYVAGTVGAIARAAAISSNDSSLIGEDEVEVHLVAYGTPYAASGYYPPAAPTTAQIAEVAALYVETGTYPAMITLSVSARAAIFRDITVDVRIYKAANYTAAQVKASITSALQVFFAVATDLKETNTAIDFGYKLLDADGDPNYKVAWSNVFNAINDATGVREISFSSNNLLLNAAHQSVILDPHEFPRLSTISVYDMDQSGVQI